MGYRLTAETAQAAMERLTRDYDVYAPKSFPGQGRYSDTDIVKYDKVKDFGEIVFDRKSTYPAKEVLTPICQAVMYFTEDEYRDSKCSSKPILLFMRPCDINAMHHQEKIYLGNGGFSDLYYARMKERVKIVLMECAEGWDTCFCVSMGTNEAQDYAMAVRCGGDGLLIQVKDDSLNPYFSQAEPADFEPKFVQENELKVTVPEIRDKEELNKLKQHEMWKEYNGRCISCGACTIGCSTCTCFSTRDVIYGDNPEVGERRRVTSSCQVKGFDQMAGSAGFRTDAASRMRYKVLHKFHDYKARFGDYHMCVGCGRCTDRCPELISISATLRKVEAALADIRKEG